MEQVGDQPNDDALRQEIIARVQESGVELTNDPDEAGRQSVEASLAQSAGYIALSPGEPIPVSDGPIKVSTQLTPKSVQALERGAETTGLNRIDTVNRAIQLFDFLNHTLGEDGVLVIERDGVQERVIWRDSEKREH